MYFLLNNGDYGKKPCSVIDGVVETLGIIPLSSYEGMVICEGEVKLSFTTKVNSTKEFTSVSLTMKTETGTQFGIDLKEEDIGDICYNSVDKTLKSSLSKDFIEMISLEDLSVLNLNTKDVSNILPILFPVVAYLRDVKPYLWETLQELRMENYQTRSGMYLRNIIITALKFPEEVEKIIKNYKPEIKVQFSAVKIEELVKKFLTKNIPAYCKKWIDTTDDYIVLDSRDVTLDLFSLITEKEDGNNALIVCKYLQALSKNFLKKRRFQRVNLRRFLKALYWLIENGWPSKQLLEYLIRQNFYLGVFSVPMEEACNLMDYASMAIENNFPYERWPSNLNKAHNIMVKNLDSIKLSEDLRDVFIAAVAKCKKYELRIGDWEVIAPTKPEDICKEGIMLHHCIKSYVPIIAQGLADILFLRKANAPENPLYTLQVENCKVCEIKGDYNQDPPSEIFALLKNIEKKWKEGI